MGVFGAFLTLTNVVIGILFDRLKFRHLQVIISGFLSYYQGFLPVHVTSVLHCSQPKCWRRHFILCWKPLFDMFQVRLIYIPCCTWALSMGAGPFFLTTNVQWHSYLLPLAGMMGQAADSYTLLFISGIALGITVGGFPFHLFNFKFAQLWIRFHLPT